MSNAVMQLMERAGVEVTRESYIDFAYPGEKWTAELEGELPKELQDWSLFEMRDGEMVLKST